MLNVTNRLTSSNIEVKQSRRKEYRTDCWNCWFCWKSPPSYWPIIAEVSVDGR